MNAVARGLAEKVLDAEKDCPRRGKTCPIIFFMGSPVEAVRRGTGEDLRDACFRGILIGEMCRKECPRLAPLERLSTYLHAVSATTVRCP